jgi:hypothetical protein
LGSVEIEVEDIIPGVHGQVKRGRGEQRAQKREGYDAPRSAGAGTEKHQDPGTSKEGRASELRSEFD